jgi:hypothetical protein
MLYPCYTVVYIRNIPCIAISSALYNYSDTTHYLLNTMYSISTNVKQHQQAANVLLTT